MKSYIITTSGEEIPYEPESGDLYTLEELQDAVGGYIEILKLNSKRYVIVNEDGVTLGLPENKRATELMRKYSKLPMGCVIVGNVVVINRMQIA